MANPPSTDNEIPEAVVETPKRGPRVSIVWLIPLIAALIGGWLAYKTFTEQGPLITISFKTVVEAFEVGKTVVQAWKDVDVGTVEAIDVKDDPRGVVDRADEQGQRAAPERQDPDSGSSGPRSRQPE